MCNPLLLVASVAISWVFIFNKKCIFWGSILTPNTRNLTLFYILSQSLSMGSLKPVFNKKMFNFWSIFFLHINIFANKCINNARFNLFYQYVLLLTKEKQFSNLLKLLFLLWFLFKMLMAALKANFCPKNTQFYMGSWQKLLKKTVIFLT